MKLNTDWSKYLNKKIGGKTMPLDGTDICGANSSEACPDNARLTVTNRLGLKLNLGLGFVFRKYFFGLKFPIDGVSKTDLGLSK
jgi:hypothetical protein